MRLRLTLIFLAFGTSLFAASPDAPAVSADDALARLRDGNARYRTSAPSRPHQGADRRVDTAAHGQQPFAVLLSCSDSRVPPEIIFDQGMGDLFVIRVAGNSAGVDETATVEYGTDHLGAPVCVVLGHSGCGAVKAASEGAKLEGPLGELIGAVVPAVERARAAAPSLTGESLLAAAVEANVWLSIEHLFQRSATLRSLAARGRLRVVGAVYDLTSGEVRWLGEHPEQKRLLASPESKLPTRD